MGATGHQLRRSFSATLSGSAPGQLLLQFDLAPTCSVDTYYLQYKTGFAPPSASNLQRNGNVATKGTAPADNNSFLASNCVRWRNCAGTATARVIGTRANH
jgi:hypothetical protein